METTGGARERKPVRVTIAKQSLTVVTTGSEQEVLELAQRVDELISGLAARTSGSVDTARLAILACLHLADQLRTTESEIQTLRERVDALRGQMQAETRRISGLLDRIIE
jgi:cell division protein ZapA